MDHPDPNTRWKNRRRMAWLSLFMLCAISAAVLFYIPELRAKAIENMVITLIFVFAGLVGTYMGAATLAEASFWNKKP